MKNSFYHYQDHFFFFFNSTWQNLKELTELTNLTVEWDKEYINCKVKSKGKEEEENIVNAATSHSPGIHFWQHGIHFIQLKFISPNSEFIP